ncbi:hypothetical protein GLI01_21570 [Gluconacetobacter liquefaciens]|uniref:DUF4142 domain-containing protein n=1 Tax=Gluconacetobacter liquefaciens TaxID=89584 RepID=A0A370G3W4_GLULI|nr:DUF4142 domain-containing protein [Gluconacetobacter liquefaciens]MBB2186703.1 DUF4142 domain-containing protein [Gluconacetobacter liquefaciens]RDI37890.1 putative membrane protein [Gluconacetobacter liquefaciens]GEB38122.1 hypothetical protein GLI01_21570 [Gluconacetobacter liquefaciens]
MTKFTRWLPVVALLPLAACATAPKPAPMPQPPSLTETDITFLDKAARSNDFIIAAAKLADTQARDPHVKTFAARLVTDHTASQDRLKAIADQHGTTLPDDLDTDEEHVLDSLKAEKGRAFDRDFTALQIAGHDNATQLFQAEATNGTDPALKAYATDMQADIQSHLDMAKALGQHRHHHRLHH